MIDLEQVSDDAQAYFDEFVVSGTDDELFASGYLRGHVDLVLGTAIVSGESLNVEQFVQQVETSVNTAIKNGELNQDDVVAVNGVLNGLLKKL